MSRLTTSQVISLGQYLEPDFDPASLTVSQLLGVLGYHNIKYPTPYSKPKLVQLFNDEIKPRSAKLKKERLKKENSIASDEGIKDGLTGKPLTAAAQSAQPVRRSSRRLSHAPNQETESSPVRRASPKRRRSSAQPELAGPSRRMAPAHLTLIEESESEDPPMTKVVRGKKSNEVKPESRRVSQRFAEDSGWEDNNIFQSGAEDSSPVRPSPAKARLGRKSTGKKSRKSSSAPPQSILLSSPLKDEDLGDTVQPLPQLDFRPGLNSPAFHRGHNAEQPGLPSIDTFNGDVKAESDHEHFFASTGVPVMLPGARTKLEFVEEVTEDSASQEQSAPTHDTKVTISDDRKQVTSRQNGEVMGSRLSVVVRLLVISLLFVVAAVILQYKTESAAIGYCQQGSDSNEYLDTLRAQRNDTELCNWENIVQSLEAWSNETNENIQGSRQRMSPSCLPKPQYCTPCPEHATCDQYSLACDSNYILRSHPLLGPLPAIPSRANASLSFSTSTLDVVWKMISIALDGLPGLGSVALPPRCKEDPKRKRNIGALGKAIEALLGQERGKRLCVGGKILTVAVKPEDGGEAKKWGVELGQLRETMRKKTSPHLLASFDDTFNEAIQQLVQWGNVIIREDQEGKRFLAHGTPDLTLACLLIVKSRDVWAQWRATVLGLGLAILMISIGRARRTQKRAETKRVAELVQTALGSLRNQEMAHHTDPIRAPQPYLSSLQLRDLVLQDQLSIPLRKRLWDQVESIVEENANVRVNLQEVEGGDEMRVWRWVGNVGRGPVGQIEGAQVEQETES